MHALLVGGPLDGHTLRNVPDDFPPTYRWVEPITPRLANYAAPDEVQMVPSHRVAAYQLRTWVDGEPIPHHYTLDFLGWE